MFKYELILCLNELVIVSWRFKSINQVVAFLDECCLGVVTPHLYRIKDHREMNVDELMEIWHG